MIFNPQIYFYLVFVVAEASLYFFMAGTYHRRMVDYDASWNHVVAIEKYIVAALWMAGIFYTFLSLSNIYTVLTISSAPYVFHLVITFANAAKRVLTLGVVLIVSSGRRLSTPLIIAAATYYVMYVSISEYLRSMSHTLHHHDHSVWTMLWPTTIDIAVLGYAWLELQQTILHIEESQQMRKLQRYCHLSRLTAFVFVMLCVKQILSLLPHSTDGAFVVEMDQLTFFLLLTGVGALWWPSPANRDYENVVEILPTSIELEREIPLFSNNDEGDNHELEFRMGSTNYPTSLEAADDVSI